MLSAIRKRLKSGFRLLLELGQPLGVNVTPSHFYSQIPNIRDLRRRQDWRAPFPMAGVDIDRDRQVGFVAELMADAAPEVRAAHATGCASNGSDGYGPIEAELLFAFILRHRPQRIVQIGCGVSTAIILAAAEKAGYKPAIRCIEPFPSAYLQSCAASGLIELVAAPAQSVPLTAMTELGEGDLFFVDSTHTVKPGSEVNRIILDVLPRLAPGVWVHFHDIYFPFDYQRGILDGEIFFNSESTLLHAFLIGNARYQVVASMSWLHHNAREAMTAAFPSYRPGPQRPDGLTTGGHFPSACWLRVKS